MKMMKLFASCAMVAALTAVCASGAFAASAEDICSDYVADEGATTGSVTITPGTYAAAGDYTVLVYPAEVVVDGATVSLNEVAEISDSYIKQIDQNSTGTFTLKFNNLADGDYYVRLGGADDGYVYDTFTVGEVNEPEMVLIGDANGDTTIVLQDASEVAKNCVGMTSGIDASDLNYLAAAYSDGNNSIALQDASEIAKYCVGTNTTYVGKTVEAGTYGEVPAE